MTGTSGMEDQTAGMVVCEPVTTNESITSTDSTRSNGNIKAVYHKFMNPIDSSHQVSQQSGSLIRRSSVDRVKQCPETPTRSLPISSNRLRQKTWASVASKGVDAIRSSAKSTNYSKRTPYRNGQSSGAGSYRLISVTQAEEQSTPCPGKRTKECIKQNSQARSIIEKALPSEKPLPCPPESDQEADKRSTPTSRTIIDAKDATLHRSPPENPHVNEEWPALAPANAEDEAEDGNKENNLNDEAKLARIEEETCTLVPDGVRMFADALSKLTIATACNENSNGQHHTGGNKSELEKDTAVASVDASTKWNTPTRSQLSTNVPFPASGKPLSPNIVTNFTRKPVQAEPSFAYHNLRPTPGYHALGPKPNPFKNRPRVASSPSSANSLPSREHRAASYSFDHPTPSAKSPLVVTPKGKSTGIRTPSNPFYAVSLNTTPRMDRSGSRIPRMSPRTLFPTSESDLGSSNGSQVSPLSPSKRSSIPLPVRLLYKNRDEDVPDSPIEVISPSTVFDRVDTAATEKAVKERETSEIVKAGAVSIVNAGRASQVDLREEIKSLAENTDPFSDEVTVKQLSKNAPSHGPQLRISAEAERLIMGEEDNKLPETNAKENHGPSRQSGSRREFRLSTDGLFATFASKRSKSSSYRLSFSGKPPTEENSPTTAGGATGRSIPKAKSADFGIRRVSSGHRSTRRKSSPEKEPPCPSSEKAAADPFSDNVEKESDSKPPTKAECEQPIQSGELNEDSRGSPAPESTKKSLIPVAVGETTPSPTKTHGSVERVRKSQNEALKMNSPRSPRHINKSSTSYGSPRRYARRQSTDRSHHRPKLNPNGTDQPPCENTENQGQKEKRHKKRHHRSADPIAPAPEPVKAKGSAAKGVFSNFRGLFTKHKAEGPKENTRHLLSYAKPTVTSHLKLSVPASHSVPHLGTNGNGNLSGEFIHRHPEPPRSPALRDTGRISRITMEILDSARHEVDTSRKEKLIRLGKILIEAVNNSHDAEKAMLTAIQAAKEAEVACAMAKENAMKMSQVACDWTRPLALTE
ncbi:uncharacterized protein GIQ15_03964 [Arthroderma uncinatum]|uniref:uncharacterized protein n=1 Tax=Arthroderma uncinatum TaxID=74035 RepID=UPI00144A9386|nr:uncharacterized protein GIQ15_03964 [Arthroderma uncinatum]KAF3481205.1 hypothetical protein GIQ15_03964 [Arthroderma uncinatum]